MVASYILTVGKLRTVSDLWAFKTTNLMMLSMLLIISKFGGKKSPVIPSHLALHNTF